MSFQGYSVSKSSFLKFVQCEKAFFLHRNHSYLKDKTDTDRQLTFNRGHAVGGLAQELFPGGTDVSKLSKNTAEALELTAGLLSKKTKTIYEAAFIFDKVLIMVDILNLEEGRYTAYEVKSSLKVSETYLLDACLQYYVLKNSVDPLDDFFLVTLNGDYVREENLDVKKLFKKRSVKPEAEKNLEYFREKIKEANLVLEKNSIPDISIGRQCYRPYQCDFFGSCWKDVHSEKSVFNLPFINKDVLFEWNKTGIRTVDQVDDSLLENQDIRRIKNAFVTGEAIIKKEKIIALVQSIQFPVAALDMEIWSAAIPVLKGTKPFQQVPFLFCIDDTVAQSYYLAEHHSDERRNFALQLIEQTKTFKSLLVYDKTMEDQAINGLMNLYEDLAPELKNLKEKLVDLSDIFKNLDYYAPSFKNNFSLKTVSEALKLEVSFDKIKSGLEAMNYFEKMRSEQNPIDKQLIQEDIIRYCFSDTRATFLLFNFLRSIQ
jgi:predicted RecB family nuclease